MNARRLIDDASAAGFSIDVDGEDIIVEADRDPSPELIAELRQHKAELIAFLSPPPPSAESAPTACPGDEERPAIIEHDGGIPREWGEGVALLDADRAPADVPPKRWQRFVDDVGLFLDSPFCAVAAALGWGPFDLFGCDRDRPFARIDRAGLLWLVNGNKLAVLTDDTAGIAMQTGARQTYRRRPDAPGRVLAWELAP